MTCKACEIEAEMGTEAVPHPVDARLHTCMDLDPKTRRTMAAQHLRAAVAMLEEMDALTMAEAWAGKAAVTDGEAFDVEVIVRKTPRQGWVVSYGATPRGSREGYVSGLSGEDPSLAVALARAFDKIGAAVRRVVAANRPPDPTTIHVNAHPTVVQAYRLTYEDVCALANLDPTTNPTVTWLHLSPLGGRSGILDRWSPPVRVEENLHLTVIHTGNA